MELNSTFRRVLMRIVADPSDQRSAAGRARRKRFAQMVRRFPNLTCMRVLDLGGTPDFWMSAAVRPNHVTVVNLERYASGADWIQQIVADACSVDVGRFDLVVSNSLLEHIGGHFRRQQLTDVIHRAAPRHWIQTPYKYFPVEPHWVCPGMQFLPTAARSTVAQHWQFGHVRQEPDRAAAVASVLDIELLSISEMRHYFPASDIWIERSLGLPKSLVAIRN